MLRLPPDESRHAIKTLRLREGDRIELCDGRGWVTTAQIAELGDRAGAVVHALDPGPLLVPRTGWQWEVACACGSLKGGRSDWLVEKCAELGAAAFVPLLTQRSPNIGSADPGGGDGGKAERRGGKSGRRRAGERRTTGACAVCGSAVRLHHASRRKPAVCQLVLAPCTAHS